MSRFGSSVTSTWSLIALPLAVLVLGGGQARADAVLKSDKVTLFPTRVEVRVKVVAQVEVTEVRLQFPDVPQRADYALTVPGPEDAFSMGVDLDRGQGYKELGMVAESPHAGAAGGSGADSAVAKWQGSAPLLADLADLAPGPLSVRVWFQRLLRRYKGKVEFKVGVSRCPLRSGTMLNPSVLVEVDCKTFRPLASFTAQGAGVAVAKPAADRAVASLNTTLASDATVTISYEEQSKGIHANFLTHRTPTADPTGGTDGYFMLILDADEIKAEDALPRRLGLVIDQSGSMSGSKIEQARKAALAMVSILREGDHFNIHTFNQSVHSFWSAPVPASAANLNSAKGAIEQLYAAGSTNLDDGIKAGLGAGASVHDGGRFDAMVLLSDGQPTAGVTDPGQILKNSLSYNKLESRIYTFAVGTGADRNLMEALARSSRGRSFVLNNMQADKDLADKVKRLFEDIYAVRVVDISVSVLGLTTSEVLPRQAADLFSGGQMILVGRYSHQGAGTARLTGRAGVVPYQHDVLIDAPDTNKENVFIKYVWATEMVGQLLADMVGKRNDSALQDRISKLGMAYRIQTPYTSFSSKGTSPSGGAYYGSGYASSEDGCSCDVTSPAGSGTGSLLLVLLGLVALRRRRRRS